MLNIKQGLPFLKMRGLFFESNRRISDLSMNDLKKMLQDAIINSDFKLGVLIAQKMSILYGLDGLIPYFNINFLLTEKNKNDGEIIDQDVIKALSLIFFVKNNLHYDLERKQIDELENKFLSICKPSHRNEIILEAKDLCGMYMGLVSGISLNGHTDQNHI